MILRFSKNFRKQYKKLPRNLQGKIDKQVKLLLIDFRHPSLKASKKSGSDEYEARVDYHYRFTYCVNGEEISLLVVGPHDEGLGKK